MKSYVFVRTNLTNGYGYVVKCIRKTKCHIYDLSMGLFNTESLLFVRRKCFLFYGSRKIWRFLKHYHSSRVTYYDNVFLTYRSENVFNRQLLEITTIRREWFERKYKSHCILWTSRLCYAHVLCNIFKL